MLLGPVEIFAIARNLCDASQDPWATASARFTEDPDPTKPGFSPPPGSLFTRRWSTPPPAYLCCRIEKPAVVLSKINTSHCCQRFGHGGHAQQTQPTSTCANATSPASGDDQCGAAPLQPVLEPVRAVTGTELHQSSAEHSGDLGNGESACSTPA